MARTTFSGPVKSNNGFEGAVTGNITGNVTGNLTGNVTGDVTGNVTGSVSVGITSGATAAEINLNCDQSGYSETLTAAGAVTSSLTKRVHALDTTLGAQTCTPAAPGAANYGVVNVWTMTVRPGTDNSVFTLTNFRGGSAATSATFDAVGETLTAIGGPDNKWHIIGEDGVTLA